MDPEKILSDSIGTEEDIVLQKKNADKILLNSI